VIGQAVFLAVIALSLVACTSTTEKQWYKPNGNYTMADFDRDRADCTKNKVLVDQCMEDRVWVSLSSDTDKGIPQMKGGSQTNNDRTRYAPK